MGYNVLLTVVEVAATFAFAMSGLFAATRKNMDIVGVFCVAFVSAFGGGTLRDVLLDRRPFFWVQNPEYVLVVVLLTLLAPPLLRVRNIRFVELATEISDAVGLGLFTVSGISLANIAGMPPLIALIMGVITAVFGGVTRDLFCAEIPKTFHDHIPYSLCAFAGGALFLATPLMPQLDENSAASGCVCIVTAFRVLSVLLGWKVPAWPPPRNEETRSKAPRKS